MKHGARIGDQHTCPQQAPAPHVGGPIEGTGAPKVLLEHMPGAVLGDVCACATGPDATKGSSATVWYQGKLAVRKGDDTAHGGVITTGAATVLVGD